MFVQRRAPLSSGVSADLLRISTIIAITT
jgi:hypothetical protein